jgi:hypothetical protein
MCYFESIETECEQLQNQTCGRGMGALMPQWVLCWAGLFLFAFQTLAP